MKREIFVAMAAWLALSAPATSQPQQNKLPKFSQSEIDQFRKRLRENWNPRAGMTGIVVLRVKMTPDGDVAERPTVVSAPTGNNADAQVRAAIRALYMSEPFDMLEKDHYDAWKDMEITIDPRELFKK